MTYLVVTQQLRHQLGHLQQGDVLADATSRPVSELLDEVNVSIRLDQKDCEAALTAKMARSIATNLLSGASSHRSGLKLSQSAPYTSLFRLFQPVRLSTTNERSPAPLTL